jgi:hypothetical protein
MLGELLFKVYAQKEYALYIFVILTSLNLLFRSDCESWDRGGKGDDDVWRASQPKGAAFPVRNFAAIV